MAYWREGSLYPPERNRGRERELINATSLYLEDKEVLNKLFADYICEKPSVKELLLILTRCPNSFDTNLKRHLAELAHLYHLCEGDSFIRFRERIGRRSMQAQLRDLLFDLLKDCAICEEPSEALTLLDWPRYCPDIG